MQSPHVITYIPGFDGRPMPLDARGTGPVSFEKAGPLRSKAHAFAIMYLLCIRGCRALERCKGNSRSRQDHMAHQASQPPLAERWQSSASSSHEAEPRTPPRCFV